MMDKPELPASFDCLSGFKPSCSAAWRTLSGRFFVTELSASIDVMVLGEIKPVTMAGRESKYSCASCLSH